MSENLEGAVQEFDNEVAGLVTITAIGEVRDAEGNLISQEPYTTTVEMTYGEYRAFLAGPGEQE
jgi:uncharacterized lipoprotein YmbA